MDVGGKDVSAQCLVGRGSSRRRTGSLTDRRSGIDRVHAGENGVLPDVAPPVGRRRRRGAVEGNGACSHPTASRSDAPVHADLLVRTERIVVAARDIAGVVVLELEHRVGDRVVERNRCHADVHGPAAGGNEQGKLFRQVHLDIRFRLRGAGIVVWRSHVEGINPRPVDPVRAAWV